MIDDSLRDARLGSPPSLLGYAYQLLAAATWSSLSWLGTLQQPTLVIAGDDDRVTVPANGVQLARLLANSRLQLLPGEGHLALFDPASRAQPLLADFFSARDLAKATSWQHAPGGLSGLTRPGRTRPRRASPRRARARPRRRRAPA